MAKRNEKSDQEKMIYQIKRLYALKDIVESRKESLFNKFDNLTDDEKIQLKLLVSIEQELSSTMMKVDEV